MAMKLEDLIGKKKEIALVLDLSKATANSADELKKVLEKVPEFRTKAEKVKPEDIKLQDKESRWKIRRQKKSKKEYQFASPIPIEMQSLRLDELCSVSGIQWTMLTTLRPKNKLDEEYFSRLIELGKLRLQTEEKEKRIPDAFFRRRMKNRAGVVETRYISCKECGEEFCQKETCCQFQYDSFRRASTEIMKKVDDNEDDEKKERKRKRKGVKSIKSKIRRSKKGTMKRPKSGKTEEGTEEKIAKKKKTKKPASGKNKKTKGRKKRAKSKEDT